MNAPVVLIQGGDKRQMPPDLVSIPVACRDYLPISDETGYQLAKAGRFPGDAAFRVGRKWVVSVPKLLRYMHGDGYQPANSEGGVA